jgi:hypothetical protein
MVVYHDEDRHQDEDDRHAGRGAELGLLAALGGVSAAARSGLGAHM